MKSILNKQNKIEILSRLEKLNENSNHLWGKMNARQMVCHCSDQIRISLGLKKTVFRGNFLIKKILKNLILLGMKTPKGKVETAPEIKQGVGGTTPTEFNNDKKQLIDLLTNFDNSFEDKAKTIHSAFGELSKKEWGILIYLHMDHHLSQFSC